MKVHDKFGNKITHVDLGCGAHKQTGCVGIDQVNCQDIDIVADIDKEGIPLLDNSVSYLYTADFLEHVKDLDKVIREIYRVCKKGAKVEIFVPHFTMHPYEFHVRMFRYRSLIDYEVNQPNKMVGMPDLFKCVRRELVFTGIYRLFSNLMNKIPEIYEGTFLRSFVLCANVHIVFEVIK